MNALARDTRGLPAGQIAIINKCFHPTGTFIKFRKTEVGQSIPSRFEEQVRRFPERLAIKTEDGEQTYTELNAAANRVATAILARRGRGEEPVALLFEQCGQAIIASLGALKAGKTYVPLDPSLPRTRTAFIVKDSEAVLIVTNGQNLALARELAVGDGHHPQVLNIDEPGDGIAADDPSVPISPDSVAWIIYTSGSTG